MRVRSPAESSAGLRATGSCRALSSAPPLFLFERNHSIGPLVPPRRGCAVADTDGDDRKGWSVLRPLCLAVADDNQKVDRIALPLDERAQAGTHVRTAAAVQLDVRRSKHLPDVV